MSDKQSAKAPTVSMANTKKEMLAAYQEVKQLLQAEQQELLDVEKQKERFKKQAAVVTADRAAAEDPVHRIQDLKSSIGRELTAMAEKFEAEIEQYKQLQIAIAERQAELQRIYEVETAASDLAALLEAQRLKKEQLAEDMRCRREEFETEMEQVTANWKQQKQTHDRQLQEEKETRERLRKREEEEYDYSLQREREQRKNGLEDEIAATTKEIAALREEFERQSATKQAELDERENAVAGREAHVNELQQQVDRHPQEIEEKLAAAVKASTERLTAEHTAVQALNKKEFEGERNVLASKIEALEKLVETQSRQIDALSRQQEMAYEKVQDIASKAVAGARANLFSLAHEHGRRKPSEAAEIDTDL